MYVCEHICVDVDICICEFSPCSKDMCVRVRLCGFMYISIIIILIIICVTNIKINDAHKPTSWTSNTPNIKSNQVPHLGES